jgi:6-pyruvoyltetrahydropterin/6-carboxytetrahydropterin synthase
MWKIEVSKKFTGTHHDPGVKGREGVLHGHTFELVAVLVSEDLLKSGYLLERRDIERLTNVAVEDLDYNLFNEVLPFSDELCPVIPTLENVAEYLYMRISALLDNAPGMIDVESVSVSDGFYKVLYCKVDK